ncbi:hypothetical protein MSKU15_1475 [Komagataeibacter diospyri]|nr:hypothetical protein MSKU15_1475 [Komagataeibacter diospyri]
MNGPAAHPAPPAGVPYCSNPRDDDAGIISVTLLFLLGHARKPRSECAPALFLARIDNIPMDIVTMGRAFPRRVAPAGIIP